MSHFVVLTITNKEEYKSEKKEENLNWAISNQLEGFEECLENDFQEIEEGEFVNIKEYADSDGISVEEYLKNNYSEHEGKYGYWYNPKAKWDWYSIGGRWGNYFNDSKYFKDGNTICLSEYKSFVKNKQEKIKNKLTPIYEDFKLLFPENIEILDWQEVLQRHENSGVEGYIKFARNEYNNDPIINQIKDFYRKNELSDWGSDFHKDLQSLENFIDSFEDGFPYAFLMDKEWYERGEMGWFGVSHNEMNSNNWGKIVEEKLFNIENPENYWITAVDCHI